MLSDEQEQGRTQRAAIDKVLRAVPCHLFPAYSGRHEAAAGAALRHDDGSTCGDECVFSILRTQRSTRPGGAADLRSVIQQRNVRSALHDTNWQC